MSWLLLALAPLAHADFASTPAGNPDTLETVELMRVDGTLVIDATGGVVEATIATPLITALQSSVDRTMRQWRFKPVVIGGSARKVATAVRLVLVASRVGDNYRVKIDSVSFSDADAKSLTRADGEPEPITAKLLGPPMYPRDEQRRGLNGTVLMAIRVLPDGRAGDVVVVQSMLYDVTSGGRMGGRGLKNFEDSARSAVRRWTFNVPADGATRAAEQMTVMAAIEYNMGYQLHTPGQWLTVVRYPRRNIAWLPKPAGSARQPGLASATGNGGIEQLASAFKLENDVEGTPLL